ncbi:hypothetical protein PFICI_05338 [Pestalotiopsis fici W106-1]|uniref:Uncharacterized protein n=1 Tax=Pestalotiopsis fici (strain W106-1 / CGMCC3.15140) TaxID=1229662 RepID=W3XDG7_PESFW|nr:uncharacterized protein PFICI_05338 [Pestalotiopsis fici W106-1]ETS83462.1 hypothetical protein PFICI_05338 [Pestalotiopsis fici W106-1]
MDKPPSDRDLDLTEKTTTPSAAITADAKSYAFSLGDRVKSFGSEPLHSIAYLKYLARYLTSPFSKQQHHHRQHVLQKQNIPHNPFVIVYELKPGERPVARPYSDPESFADFSQSGNNIIFLTGRPSAEWLNIIGSKYQLDPRIFHQHLGALFPGQKHCYAVPSLPSRSLQSLRLRIPTILFIGSQGRNLGIKGLELARDKCNGELRRAFRSFQDSAISEAGTSIIRNIDIYDGSNLVIEQEITAYVIRRGNDWSVLIWNDAGHEKGFGHIPVPPTEHFTPVATDLQFCPVFFENNLTETRSSDESQLKASSHTQQSSILLNRHYGATIDWTQSASISPLYILQELLDFNAAAISQYINMVEEVLTDIGSPFEFPSYEHTKLEAILHYDYIKARLTRLIRSLAEVRAFLLQPPGNWSQPSTVSPKKPDEHAPRLLTKSEEDFQYLFERAQSLIAICEDGKSTLISNASVQDALRSAAETKLVTRLTKATNRVTFIFLPISFITAVFGMNFQEFGQGDLPLWIWAAVTVPLLLISVLFVEKGDDIRSWSRSLSRKVG